jgi:hypothetical protein
VAFARELDSLRPELRAGAAGTVSHWPKVDGQNVLATAATFKVFDEGGTELQSGAASLTAVGAVHRIDCAVSALSDLADGYRVEVTWTYASTTYFAAILFDVVLHPWVHSETISLNDLLEARPDVDQALDRLGVLLGYTAGEDAQNAAAAIMAERARVRLDAWLRSAATESGDLRPALIIDRVALSRVERPLALAALFESNAQDPEDGDAEPDALYRHYTRRAEAEFKALRLAYDSSEDGTPDAVVRSLGSVVRTERVQG